MFKFPDKENPNMTDRQWETYCILTWGLNSMNEAERSLSFYENPIRYYFVLMRRAQDIIGLLLEETGRLDEWELFKEKEEDDKNTI